MAGSSASADGQPEVVGCDLGEAAKLSGPVSPGHLLTRPSFVEHERVEYFCVGYSVITVRSKDSSSHAVGVIWWLQGIMAGTHGMKLSKQERKFLIRKGKSPTRCLCTEERGLESHRTLCDVGKSICPPCQQLKVRQHPLPAQRSEKEMCLVVPLSSLMK